MALYICQYGHSLNIKLECFLLSFLIYAIYVLAAMSIVSFFVLPLLTLLHLVPYHITREWKIQAYRKCGQHFSISVSHPLHTHPAIVFSMIQVNFFFFFLPFWFKIAIIVFFLFWHLTLYGRLPKILAPKFAKYVLSSSIVLISVFGHVVDPERKAQFSYFLYLQH